jgi:hypothetical protein
MSDMPPNATDQQADDPQTAFPASELVPGQAESRSAYARMLEQVQHRMQEAGEGEAIPGWWAEYLALRAEGWDWRKAAFIAWAASPVVGRWPETQDELAQQVLGLKSDRVISKWKADNPEMGARIEAMQVAPLMVHRRDVIEALIAVASQHSPTAHQDRKLFLEMTGDYKQTVNLAGLKTYVGVSPDDWDEEEQSGEAKSTPDSA